MRKLFLLPLIAAASLALSACAGLGAVLGPPENLVPAAADSTTLDEKVGLGVEIAYFAAVKAGTIAIKTKAIKGDDVEKAEEYKAEALKAVCITRAAYDAANGIPRSENDKRRCDHLLPDVLPKFEDAEAIAKKAINRLLAIIP